MTADLTLIQMFLNASLVVQGVMLLLLFVSLVSWTRIFRKWSFMKQAQSAAKEFEERFWSGNDLTTLYKQLTSRRHTVSGMEGIFESGFKEFARMRNQAGIDALAMVEAAQRAMRATLSREVDELETHLPFLATVGSTSPYIGLFGTVWGIMNSFRALGNVHQATLALVAPGIAEALVATAMGLFAAIPAVIAYNRYSADVERLINRYDTFVEEFSTILQRHAHVRTEDKARDGEAVLGY